nr:Polyketide cyclase / dehydrase and lipid transport [uncultured bacterium]
MRAIPLIVLALLAAPASAEVVGSNANGFQVRQSAQIVVPPAATYAAFGKIGRWWSGEHTYSGKSDNLSLSLNPGGCFCERLDGGGGIEHLRVTYVDPGKLVLLTGSLGPLLYEATTGVMDVQFERIAGGTKVTLDYRVAGFANGGAEKLAPLVDSVLAEQFKRFREFARNPQAGR